MGPRRCPNGILMKECRVLLYEIAGDNRNEDLDVSGFPVALSLILGALSFTSLPRVARGIQALATHAMPGVKYGGDIAAGSSGFRGNAWKHIASNSATDMAATEQLNTWPIWWYAAPRIASASTPAPMSPC